MIRQCNKQLYFISKKRKIKIYLKKEQTNLLLYAFEDVSRWDEKKSHVYMHISALRHLHPSVPWPFQAPPLLPQMISTLKKKLYLYGNSLLTRTQNLLSYFLIHEIEAANKIFFYASKLCNLDLGY
jgi:hypothetical protein